MKPRVNKVVPTVIMTAATAIPVVTAIEILNHASGRSAQSSLSAAALPTSTPQPAATATAQPQALPTTAAPKATAKPTVETYTGPAVQDQFGAVQAVITVTNNRITNISISAPENDPRSASINSQAVPMLQSETLQAQSANVNTISGATETSNAYDQSLQAAITQARQAGALK